MSLIGSLEDLSLADILQIISLSQKSGVLLINTSMAEGRITFRGGLVRAAVVKGGPEDFRSLLVGGGFLDEGAYEAALAASDGDPAVFERALAECGPLGAEKLESLRREAVEAAVVEMFRWTAGAFSFEVGGGEDLSVEALALPTGINAQYLAMEGARVSDESERGHEAVASDAFTDSEREAVLASAETAFSEETYTAAAPPGSGGATTAPASPFLLVEETVEDGSIAADELEGAPLVEDESADSLFAEQALEVDLLPPEALADLEPLTEPTEELGELLSPESDLLDPELEDEADATQEIDPAAILADVVDHVAMSTVSRADASPEALAPLPSPPAVIVIEPDLRIAEWVKEALTDSYEPVHIFQRPDLGLNRIRQYLARAQQPLVLLSPDIEGDPIGGIRDAGDFASRLKKQSSRMSILWMVEEGVPAPDSVDGHVIRPASSALRNPRPADEVDGWGGRFCERLEAARRGSYSCEHGGEGGGPTEAVGDDWMKRSAEVLHAASERGEVLPLVLDAASRGFGRVALFAVRATQIVGITQRGLAAGGGPDDAALGSIVLSAGESTLFDQVLESRAPVRLGPESLGDPILAALLGGRAAECYAAPVESGGQIVALLYADNLPGDAAIGDTSALEGVLHNAGLALDRGLAALADGEGI